MRSLSLAAACLLVASHAHAQAVVDPRWTPFLGCWDLVAQDAPQAKPAQDRNPAAARPSIVRERRAARVCVAPQGAGVTMTTLVGDQPVLTQTVIADASTRPIVDDTCQGTEEAQWSRDGRRLFSRATLTCPGEPDRSVSGMALMSSDGQWIDVQAVTVASRESVRVRRYRPSIEPAGSRTDGQAGATTARIREPAASERLTVEHVMEASRAISSGALEAALIESRARFALSGKTLLALDAAGVPDSVTDLMVALSYPSAFVVKRASRDDRLTSVDPYGYIGPWGMGDPYFPGDVYGPYDAYGSYFDSGYYYSPFGYSYLRSYPVVFGGGIGAFDAAGVGAARTAPREEGRVIDGLGYTQVVTTREAEAAASGDSSSTRGTSDRGAVTSQGYTGGDFGSSSSGSSGGSSGGASSGGDSGRTAEPR